MKNLTLNIISSRPDIYGNSYFAFEVFNPSNGKKTFGRISGGASNLRGMEWRVRNGFPAGDEQRWYVTEIELPIRQFNRTTKDWPYAGCSSGELFNFVQAGVH